VTVHPLAGTLPDWPDDLVPDQDGPVGRATGSGGQVTAPAVPGESPEARACAARLLARVHTALTGLRRLPTAQAMVEAAPRQACAACGFDRAVLFRVHGRELIAESFWVEGDPESAARLLAFSREHPGLLVTEVMETEMVRRRQAMAIQHVIDDGTVNPRVFAELAAAYDTRSYVAAPIMPEGRVIGFIHADHRLKPRRVDDFDRDALWAFADGFGYAVERAQLADRMRAQGRELRRLLQRTEAVVAEYLDAEVELVTGDAPDAAALPEPVPGLPGTLSRRELEVLALLGAGASNAHIAARLVISEDTAKSHVKRILRKLGATNRVEAATIWLRAQPR
jgi:DNA-binding CsgD family transcriptional regulator